MLLHEKMLLHQKGALKDPRTYSFWRQSTGFLNINFSIKLHCVCMWAVASVVCDSLRPHVL